MNFLDYVIIFLLVLFFVRGLWVGATRQILSIAGLFAGFWGASQYYGIFGRGLIAKAPGWPYPNLTVFAVLFFLIWGLFAFFGFFLSRLFQKSPLAWADRLLGGSIGLVKTLVAAVILISVLTIFLPPKSPLLVQSRLAPYVQIGANLMIKATPEKVKHIFEKKRKELLDHWYKREKIEKVRRAASNRKRVMTKMRRKYVWVNQVNGLKNSWI